jgi:WD40 repeat protein
MKQFITSLCGFVLLAVCGVSISPAKLQSSNLLVSTPATVQVDSKGCPLMLPLEQQPLKLAWKDVYPNQFFSPDGRSIVVTDRSGGGGIFLVNLSTGKGQNLLPKAWAGEADFSPDGKVLAVGLRSGNVFLMDRVRQTHKILVGHSRDINSLKFSPDGQHFVTASADNTARIWHRDGTKVATLAGVKRTLFGGAIDTAPWIGDLSWSRDGHYLVSVSGRYGQIWNVNTSSTIARLQSTDRVINILFSPKGDRVFTLSGDGLVQVWNLQGHLLNRIPAAATKIAVAPDGQHLLTASETGMAHLWDHHGKIVTTFKGHRDEIFKMAFSPDGKCIFTSSLDNTVRIWNWLGQELAQISTHFNMSLSPDGKLLAVTNDQSIVVWKLNMR